MSKGGTLWLWLDGRIGEAEKIIGGGMIEAGEADQNVGGNVTQPPLITVILRLLHVQIISDLLLGEVMILPQIAETRIVVVQTVSS